MIIELSATPNGNPPDRQGEAATQCETLWVRFCTKHEIGPWKQVRSTKDLKTAAKRIATALEIES